MPVLRVEPSAKWIRGMIGDRTVVDSRQVQLVWEHERYPWWYMPAADVDASLPTSTVEELPDHVKVAWSAVERWFEEDVEVFVHPRDPYRRVDALRSSRHVVVRVDGEVVADSTRPVILYETGLRPRYYLPPDDVCLELLEASDTATGCPYKGFARYWTVTVDGIAHPELVWAYDDPLPESAPIKGLLCFYDERADVEVDGGKVEPEEVSDRSEPPRPTRGRTSHTLRGAP